MNRYNSYILVMFLLIILLQSGCYQITNKPNIDTTIETIFFGPEENIAENIVSEINKSNNSLQIMIFKFDHKPIADAIIRAKKRGVSTKVLIDVRSQFKMTNTDGIENDVSVIDYLSGNGVELKIYDDIPIILHNKAVLIDNKTVLLGTANFYTYDLKNNNENFFIIRNSNLYDKFHNEFLKVWSNRKSMTYENYKSKYNVVKTDKPLPPVETQEKNVNNVPMNIKINIEKVMFSPEDNVTKEIINSIKKAKSNVVVIASIFNYKPIANQLIESSKKGVKVKVLTNLSDLDFLKYMNINGISIKAFDKEKNLGQMHNKIILIDNDKVLCGSINLFERSLKKDLENCLVIESRQLYNIYYREFEKMWEDKKMVTIISETRRDHETSRKF